MKPIVVAFAGQIASGKSTISALVADKLNWPRISFGTYVRKVAKERGFPESREALQSLGATLVKDDRRAFCLAALQQADFQPGTSLVIDGVRHLEVVLELRELVRPSGFRLVLLEVSRQTREERLRSIGRPGDSTRQVEEHSTETQVGTQLPSVADLVVQSDKAEEVTVQEILAWIRKQAC